MCGEIMGGRQRTTILESLEEKKEEKKEKKEKKK
jgi:aspartyl/asparaginyl-tRNA synthetase